MATLRKRMEHPEQGPGKDELELASAVPPAQRPPLEESLGEQVMREAHEGDAEFVAGWRSFMEELNIQGQPIGARKLRALLLQQRVNPDDNEFSRGIVAMREESRS
jgi:hypothetical protein